MRRLLLFASFGVGALAMGANSLTVLESRLMPNENALQIVEDAQGRIFRRLVKPSVGTEAEKQATAASAAAERTFYEGFEGWEESFGLNWIPDGWTEQNTEANIPTEEQLSHNVNNSWYTYYSSDLYQEMTTDGTKEAFIHFGYDGDWCEAVAQDEWLITPSIRLAANEQLHFMLQADLMNVYNCDDFDWNTITWPERIVVNTMKVMLSTDDGASWVQLWDLAEDVASKMTDRECYDASDLRIRHFDVSLSEYAGQDVKIAFRYVRDEGDWIGNSMILDGIIVDHEPTGNVESIEVAENAAADYYNLNGMRVDGDNLVSGIYLRRQGTKVEKIIVGRR